MSSEDRSQSSPARARILARIREGLGVSGDEPDRRAVVARRLESHDLGPVPARARQSPAAHLALLRELLEGQSATVAEIASLADLPATLASYLRSKNLPLAVRAGDDPLWAQVPWEREPALTRTAGPAIGADASGLSHAVGAVAETGTLVLTSGTDNPTTLNFLPETHLVVVREADVVGGYEEIWARLRAAHGDGVLPRAVNFVSGPSRTADIEQQLVMGAHGPRRMLVVIVKEALAADR